ncbi:transposase [Candidatus Poribacteria bacterium]|nr:transposase [Candidatus Poribacteria bacterium]
MVVAFTECHGVIATRIDPIAGATCSDGTTFENPRPLKRYERKLARANRRLSRRQKGSQNWHQAKRILTSVHARKSMCKTATSAALLPFHS